MKTFLKWALIALVVVVLVGYCTPKDNTDPPDGRSGMGLRVDHATGCQYLTSASLVGESGITPRLRADGTHYCEARP